MIQRQFRKMTCFLIFNRIDLSALSSAGAVLNHPVSNQAHETYSLEFTESTMTC